MNNYEQDIHYNTNNLSLKQKTVLLYEAMNESITWWVDILDGWQRKKIDMSFGDIMKKLNGEVYFTFIHRRGFKDIDDIQEYIIEVGFSGENHYLWILVNENRLDYYVKKYKLEKK